MMLHQPVTFESLLLEPAREALRIEDAIRSIVVDELGRRGVVIGLSGGIDSSVAAALCVNALGSERVFALLMPESDSREDSLRLGRVMAESLGIVYTVEDISAILDAAGCYRRRDEAIRLCFPAFGEGWKCKVVLADVQSGIGYPIPFLVVQDPEGRQTRVRLSAEAHSQLVAATNFKQRTRKMLEFYHADRLRYAVVGTPNRLEYDQGFFVKNGDGSADLKPLAHLYKTQVYQIAAHLGIPEDIQNRPPTTDTFSLPQSQEEFYFSVPLNQMDMCLYGINNGIQPNVIACATNLSCKKVEQLYKVIESRRKATRYLHFPPLLVEPVERTSDSVLVAGGRQ